MIKILKPFFPFSVHVVNNIKTSNHVNITGTRVFLIPPTGYSVNKAEQALVHSSNGSNIIVSELAGIPFEQYKPGINQQGLLQYGIKLIRTNDIIVNGNPGILVLTEQLVSQQVFVKYTMSFGDDRSTMIMNGCFYKRNAPLFKWKVLKSMFSVAHDPQMEFDSSSVGIQMARSLKWFEENAGLG